MTGRGAARHDRAGRPAASWGGAPGLALLLALAGWLAMGGAARGQDLVADLSDHHLAITTGFTGADVLIFGSLQGEGDVIVVIAGPGETAVVRRKSRIGGVWVNTERMAFLDVPSFYAVAASGDLAAVMPERSRVRHGIGADKLAPRPAPSHAEEPPARIAAFREALIQGKQAAGLYSREPGEVSVIANRLFRTRIAFPANMRPGQYMVTTYLVRDGGAVDAQSTPLLVQKVGLGAEVFEFAHRHAAVYGILAIAVAIFAGWFAEVVFRRLGR